MMGFDRDKLAYEFACLAATAGRAIMQIYHSTDQGVRLKPDQSPVTYADETAERIIVDGLTRLLPALPIIAEEAVAREGRPHAGACFLLVDALDGTREFITRNGEFTVNIALIENGVPLCGAVYAPALNHIWYGGTLAYTAHTNDEHAIIASSIGAIHCRPAPAELTALISRSHDDPQTHAYLQNFPIAQVTALGSSLKMCKIAEGEADLYVRFTPTMEWDIAAGHAIILAARGLLTTLDGTKLTYGKYDLHNPPFVCWGDAAMKNKHFSPR